MQLSKKQKAFCGVSIKFLNCSLKELHSNELVLMNNNIIHVTLGYLTKKKTEKCFS